MGADISRRNSDQHNRDFGIWSVQKSAVTTRIKRGYLLFLAHRKLENNDKIRVA